jgi:hypothetical protein
VRSASAKRNGLTEEALDDGIDNYANSTRLNAAEKLALRYSELMATDWQKVDATFYDELRQHYTEEEIVELGTFIGFNIGYHTFFGTLKFYPMFSPDGKLVSQEESARLYGANPVSLGSTKTRNEAA